MRPVTLFKHYTSMHSQDERAILRYWDEDCIVAYVQNGVSTLAMIKGRRTYFLIYQNIFSRGWNSGRVSTWLKKEENEAIKILINEGIILDKEYFQKIKELKIAEEL